MLLAKPSAATETTVSPAPEISTIFFLTAGVYLNISFELIHIPFSDKVSSTASVLSNSLSLLEACFISLIFSKVSLSVLSLVLVTGEKIRIGGLIEKTLKNCHKTIQNLKESGVWG